MVPPAAPCRLARGPVSSHEHEFAGGVCRYCGDLEPMTCPGCDCRACELAPFLHEGTEITDPHLSECGRFQVDAETYYAPALEGPNPAPPYSRPYGSLQGCVTCGAAIHTTAPDAPFCRECRVSNAFSNQPLAD